MDFAQRQPITDVCILVADIERSIAFYRDRLGFRLWHRMRRALPISPARA